MATERVQISGRHPEDGQHRLVAETLLGDISVGECWAVGISQVGNRTETRRAIIAVNHLNNDSRGQGGASKP